MESSITLTKVVQLFEDSVEDSDDSRHLQERDRDYYDNKQLTPEEIKTLRDRGQPDVIINRIKPKIDYLLGAERQMRTDPKAAPRTPMDEDRAHAATDAIRYVCDNANFDSIRSEVFENLIIEGVGGAIVEAESTRRGIEICIRRIPWDRIFYDPHSRDRNFHDAVYAGIVTWMDEAEALVRFSSKEKEGDKPAPNVQEVIEHSYDDARSDTYDDRPKYRQWVDTNRKRIRFCELYYKHDGTWYHCIYTKGGFVVDPHPSDYKDEDGEPYNPIELISCHVDRENKRYGVVRQLVGPQDEINKRRSKALHLLTMRQVVMEDGAVDNVKHMKSELAKPDGVVRKNPGMEWELLDHNDMAQGNLAMLAEAKQEIDAIGSNASLSGKEDAPSGRALQAKQQGGMVELGPVFDCLRMWQQAIYRQIWYRVRQYWNDEKWIRVTDDEHSLKWVGLNQQLTAGEQMIEQAKEQGASEEELQQMVQQLSQDPRAQQVVETKNAVTEMDMDIILDDAPDTINIQSEQFELLAQMYQANPQAIPFDQVIEASNLRNKKQILERMKPKPEEQKMQQAAQEAQMQAMMAEIRKTTAQAIKDEMAAMKTQAEIGKTQADTQGTQANMVKTLAETQNIEQNMEAERISGPPSEHKAFSDW